MTSPSRRGADTDWSPNQRAKRDAVVRATAHLMVEQGVGACSTRAIAARCAMSASALHYYFQDTDEIIDLTFRYLGTRFWNRVRAAAEAQTDPASALWHAATAYLTSTTEHGDDNVEPPVLWSEFEAASLRLGNRETVNALSEEGARIFSALLARLLPDDAEVVARVYYAALVGSAIRDKFQPRPIAEILAGINAALQIPAPAA